MVGIPECSSAGTTFIQSQISTGCKCHSHSLFWLVYKDFLPFSQFAMVGIFVRIGYPHLPHQAWHLPFLDICAYHKVLQYNFVQCPNSKPSPSFRPGINTFLFASSARFGGFSYGNFLLWQCFETFHCILLVWTHAATHSLCSGQKENPKKKK